MITSAVIWRSMEVHHEDPAGQFGWLEEATGLPISDTLAKLLSNGLGAP